MTFKNEHLTRQSDLIPEAVLGEPITIIGAGAIGSWTTLALAKMGFQNLTVYDHDDVSVENLSCQMYSCHAIGRKKVIALNDLIQAYCGFGVNIKPDRYEQGRFPGIVISAVDSMEARRLIWENHKGKSFGTRAIIDPRMASESALLFVMNPMDEKDAESYEKSLYSDNEALQEACTSKATVYCANMLSGLVCKAVKDLVTRPDYLRSAQWNIKEDAFIAHHRKPL